MMMMIMMMTLTIVTQFRRQYSFRIIPYCFCTSNISGFWARLSSYSCRFAVYEQLSRWLIIGLVVLSASSYQERNKIVIPGYYFGRTVSAKLHVSWLKTKLKTKHINEKTVYSKAHKREYHEVLTTAVSLPIYKENEWHYGKGGKAIHIVNMKMLFLLTNKAKLESKIYKHFSVFSLVEFLQKSATSLCRLLKLKLSFQRS